MFDKATQKALKTFRFSRAEVRKNRILTLQERKSLWLEVCREGIKLNPTERLLFRA